MPIIDGVSRKQLQRRALAALMDADTLARGRVFEPRDWPTDPEEFPMLLVSTPEERKVGVYPGQLEFNTTITLVVLGRVVGDDGDQVNEMLDTLSDQIEDALMLAPSFAGVIQQFQTIETKMIISAESEEHIGEIALVFDVTVFQVFGVTEFEPLRSVRSTITDGRHGETLAETNAVTAKPDPDEE